MFDYVKAKVIETAEAPNRQKQEDGGCPGWVLENQQHGRKQTKH